MFSNFPGANHFQPEIRFHAGPHFTIFQQIFDRRVLRDVVAQGVQFGRNVEKTFVQRAIGVEFEKGRALLQSVEHDIARHVHRLDEENLFC